MGKAPRCRARLRRCTFTRGRHRLGRRSQLPFLTGVLVLATIWYTRFTSKMATEMKRSNDLATETAARVVGASTARLIIDEVRPVSGEDAWVIYYDVRNEAAEPARDHPLFGLRSTALAHKHR